MQSLVWSVFVVFFSILLIRFCCCCCCCSFSRHLFFFLCFSKRNYTIKWPMIGKLTVSHNSHGLEESNAHCASVQWHRCSSLSNHQKRFCFEHSLRDNPAEWPLISSLNKVQNGKFSNWNCSSWKHTQKEAANIRKSSRIIEMLCCRLTLMEASDGPAEHRSNKVYTFA